MSTFNSPVQLSNIFKPKIWGRRDLAPFFDAPNSSSEESGQSANPCIGEVWVTDDASRFLNGPAAGMTLAEASEKYGPELHGKSWPGRRFPLLAKYIFTSDWLSVQVHPDDAYAAGHDPGNLGKCEMWYFLKTDPNAAILLGLKPGVAKEHLLPAFKAGTSRDFLQSFRPEEGEAAFLPPGIVHALGPGLVLFEVEENSDLTYRLDDFGRPGLDGNPRPLHLDKGLEVIRPELPPRRDLPRLELKEKYGTRRLVLASRFFALEELSVRHTATFHSMPERVEALSIVEGEGRFENEAGWLAYRPGETWLIPPGAGRYRMVPDPGAKVLKFYVPDLEKDFREPLRRQRIPEEKIRQIVIE
ncbi:MAG: type I phosphomannose isomerase catalytic subunit [Terriglobia bacterium]